METDGKADRILVVTRRSFEGVRDAKMRRLGLWDASARPRASPRLLGETPVMITERFCQ